MTEIALRLNHVSKRFRLGEDFTALRDLLPALTRRVFRPAPSIPEEKDEFWALRDICLKVGRGETLGVIGHNGAGKSTMLKLLAGIMAPTEGTIDVSGRLSALIEVGAGFHQDLTGRENVFLNGVILGMSRSEVSRKFDEIVDFAGLRSFIDTPVKRYSSGMYARLAFSVAAHLDPDILVVDEVLSVGDFVFQNKSLEKMRSVAMGGSTVIFVSHNLKAVGDLCKRTILLDGGSIVADGPTPEVIQTYLIRERSKVGQSQNTDVSIQTVVLRGVEGEAARFAAGDKAWVDITIRANRFCEHVAVVLKVLNESLRDVFNTSSERLGYRPLSLEEGQALKLTFELDLHLARGTFHVAVYLRRYELEIEFDRALPAATFFVESELDVRGAANLYPAVLGPRAGSRQRRQ